MQSSAAKIINRYFPSLTPAQSKDLSTFLQFENQFPETFSPFIEAMAFTGDFFLNSSNFFPIFSRPDAVFNLSSFNLSKYSSLVYFLFQMQYSPFTKFTQPTQFEQFRQA